MAGKEQKSDNVTTNDEEYYEKIRERDVYSVELEKHIRSPPEPAGITEIITLFSRNRQSPEPGKETLERYMDKIKGGTNERGVTRAFSSVIPFDDWACSAYFQYMEDKKWGKWSYRMLHEEITPHLSDPKPDHALGIDGRRFKSIARNHMGGYAAPAMKGGCWILLTIEEKSDKGSFHDAIAQNCWSAAHCVNNILALKRVLGKENSFYDVAKVFSMVISEQTTAIYAHWVRREGTRDVFWSKMIMNWGIINTLDLLRPVRRAACNLVEHLEKVIGPEIERDMDELATNLQNPAWKAAWAIPLVPERSKEASEVGVDSVGGGTGEGTGGGDILSAAELA